MPNLYIVEFQLEGVDAFGNVMPVAKQMPVASQKLAFSSSAQSATLNPLTTLVRLQPDGVCSVVFGSNPTASTNDMRMNLGQTEYFAVQPNSNLKIAAINNV